MYKIIFYKGKNGVSELLEFISDLNNKAATSKNERIMLKQIRFYINILEKLGTRAGEPFVKHIQDESGNFDRAITGYCFLPGLTIIEYFCITSERVLTKRREVR